MNEKKISIIIRTCNRYRFLRIALNSIRNQTYKNIEVVIVEDGENKSEKFIEDEFSDLNIKYISTGYKVGRVKAANIGLKNCTGDYINFLDDDDILLPIHVYELSNILNKFKDINIVHSSSYEQVIDYDINHDSEYKYIKRIEVYNEKFDKDKILFENMFPIQAVMFKRNIYDLYGGMDEKFELLEDWDLWIKYSLYSDFYFLDKITSIYNITSDKVKFKNRKKEMKKYRVNIEEKYSEYIKTSTYKKDILLKKIIKNIRKNGISYTIEKLKYKFL